MTGRTQHGFHRAVALPVWLFLGLSLPALVMAAPNPATSGAPKEAPVPAAAPEKPAPKTWTLNLRDVDIHAFLAQISAITGENFVVDPAVSGKVTVIATAPLGPNAVHELFLTVLRVNGFAAVPSGSTTRIVPLAGVHGAAMPRGPVSGQQLVTRVLPAKDVNVEDAIRILKPMVSQAGFLEGSVYSNALVVSDYADNVNQVAAALEGLGKEAPAEVEIIPLREGWVGNIVPLIESIGFANLDKNKSAKNRLRVVADERSNSLIVRGTPVERAEIRQLVQTLDKKSPNSSDIQMFRLKNSDARAMAALLRGIVFGQSTPQAALGSPNLAPAPAQQPAANPDGTPNAAAAQQSVTNLFSAATPSAGSASAAPATLPGYIQADTALNAVVVRADPSVMSEIRQLIQQLDVRRPQVMIEAAIVEITSDNTDALGVQFAAGDPARGTQGLTSNFTTPNGLSLGAFLAQLGNTATPGEGLVASLGVKSQFNVLIQALQRTAGANLLSTPSITTLDNEEAKIVVGQNVPFRTGNFTTLNGGVTSPFTTIERQDIGITLRVVPQIHGGQLVRLNIEQEISSIADTQLTAAADIITNKRTINTKVLAQDGETIVLGGLMQDDVNEAVSQVPVLGDAPVVGFLFKHKRNSAIKRNLFVFLRPTLILNGDEAFDVTQHQYKRVYDLQLGTRKLGDPDDETQQDVFPPGVKKQVSITEVYPENPDDLEDAAEKLGVELDENGAVRAPQPGGGPTPQLEDVARFMESEEAVPPASAVFDAPSKRKPPLIEY